LNVLFLVASPVGRVLHHNPEWVQSTGYNRCPSALKQGNLGFKNSQLCFFLPEIFSGRWQRPPTLLPNLDEGGLSRLKRSSMCVPEFLADAVANDFGVDACTVPRCAREVVVVIDGE
jgi:hypothetical protein